MMVNKYSLDQPRQPSRGINPDINTQEGGENIAGN